MEKKIPIAGKLPPGRKREVQITLLGGGQQDVLEDIDEPWRFIFMGCGKGTVYPFSSGYKTS